MGAISQKIKIELLNAKRSKVIDLQILREIKEQSKKRAERDDDLEVETRGQDPLFAAYSWMLRLLHDLANDLSPLSQFDPFYDVIEKKSGDYMPSGPPLSPITTSFWNYWVWFDFKQGQDRETIASIILDLADVIPYPPEFRDLLQLASASRMGVYEHLGIKDGKIWIKELVTEKSFSAICPAGYEGKKGELWFARAFPAPVGDTGYSMVATTPYVLLIQDKEDWINFFERNGIVGTATDHERKLVEFMKFGTKKKRFYWHEYIMDAYTSDESSHIFLTGIPDIPETLPHNEKSSLRIYKSPSLGESLRD